MVSVIIPSYNRALLLSEAVKSVLSQSFRELELIVVDDGSTDKTSEALRERFDDRRLRLLSQSHRGVSCARNHGIREASYPWITFLDSDDLWTRRKLERQLRALRRSSTYRIAYTDEIWIRNGVRVNPRKIHRKYCGWIYPFCLPRCIVSPSSVLLHRDVLQEAGLFDESLPVCEDYDLWLRLSAGEPFLFVPEKLIVKRGGHADQLSESGWGFDRFRVQALWKQIDSGQLSPYLMRLTLAETLEKCRVLINGFQKRGKETEAKTYRQIALMALERLERVT